MSASQFWSVAAPSLITGGALILQGILNNRRDDARRRDDAAEREKDREHSAQQDERHRREALGDHWRDERKQAHVVLLASLGSANDYLNKVTGYGYGTGRTDSATSGQGHDSTSFPAELGDAIRSQLATVQVIATSETRSAAERAWSAVLRVRVSAIVAERKRAAHPGANEEEDDADDEPISGAVRKYLDIAKKELDGYRDAVRKELGTHDTA